MATKINYIRYGLYVSNEACDADLVAENEITRVISLSKMPVTAELAKLLDTIQAEISQNMGQVLVESPDNIKALQELAAAYIAKTDGISKNLARKAVETINLNPKQSAYTPLRASVDSMVSQKSAVDITAVNKIVPNPLKTCSL